MWTAVETHAWAYISCALKRRAVTVCVVGELDAVGSSGNLFLQSLC